MLHLMQRGISYNIDGSLFLQSSIFFLQLFIPMHSDKNNLTQKYMDHASGISKSLS